MQLASVPRKLRGYHDRLVMAAQVARLTPGLAHGVTVFAYPDNLETKRIIQQIITSAKTRATAILRQQHIPPNVSGKLLTICKPMKNLTFFIALFICNLSFGQTIDIKSVDNADIIKLLNNLESFSLNKTENLSIRVYALGNEPGSAGYDNGEVTHKLYFAISEFDEYPNQKVFVVGNFFNPKAIKWNNKNSRLPELTIEFGAFDERKTLTFVVSLDKIQKK